MPVETDIDKRWEEKMDHHPKSIELMSSLYRIDSELCGDYFRWKTGGVFDVDGETFMYQMDIHFERRDEKIKKDPLEEILIKLNLLEERVKTLSSYMSKFQQRGPSGLPI